MAQVEFYTCDPAVFGALRRQASELCTTGSNGAYQVAAEHPLSSELLGGNDKLLGNVVLAVEEEVKSGDWWERHETRNIDLIVNCIGPDTLKWYPKNAATSQLLCRVRYRDHREADFELVWQEALKVLLRGGDVLIHCRESFHRAPLVAAALISKLTGDSYQVPLFHVSFSTSSKNEKNIYK